jgi:hypothetical protein
MMIARFARVDHGDRLGPLIGDVGLVERSGIRDPIRLVLGGDFLHDFHLTEIDDADLVLMPVRRVDLAAFADVGDALDARHVGDRRHNRVVPQIDHVEQPRCEVCREQLPPFSSVVR